MSELYLPFLRADRSVSGVINPVGVYSSIVISVSHYWLGASDTRATWFAAATTCKKIRFFVLTNRLTKIKSISKVQ